MTAVVSPVPVTRRLHPEGAAGAKVSLQAVADRIRKDYTDELVVAFARRVISEAGGPRGVPAKAQALLDALHKRAKYILDPTNSEYIASARHILCLDSNNKDLCHAGGDCDELCATFCSMAMAVGIDCVIVGQAFGGARVPSHVLLAVFDPQTERWLKVDPSTNLPVGKAYPATSEVEIDPLTGAVPDFDGPAPQASFVGVGEIAARPLRRRVILGDTQSDQASALGQSVLPDLLAAFTNAYFELNGAYAELVGTRRKLRGDGADIHDPEDPSIVNLSTLPDQPVFTQMVDTLTVSLLQTMVPMMTFLIEANAGARQIYFDPRVQDFLISAKTSDPWKLLTFPGTSTVKTILGFFTNTSCHDGAPKSQYCREVVLPLQQQQPWRRLRLRHADRATDLRHPDEREQFHRGAAAPFWCGRCTGGRNRCACRRGRHHRFDRWLTTRSGARRRAQDVPPRGDEPRSGGVCR